MKLFLLKDRSVLKIYGPDAKQLLHNITTNDVLNMGDGDAIYSLILDSKGRYVFDFFLVQSDGALMLDCASEDKVELAKLLYSYRFQLKVRIKNCDADFIVAANPHASRDSCTDAMGGAILFQDPRKVNMGVRGIIPVTFRDKVIESEEGYLSYEVQRIRNAVPCCQKDMIRGKSFPLHFAMDRLNAISTSKGCYIGQEVVARMLRIGAKKVLCTVVAGEGEILPDACRNVLFRGEEIGQLLSTALNLGLCIMDAERLSVSQNELLTIGNVNVRILGS